MESAVEQNGFVKENEGVLPSSKAHLESVDILRALAIISVFAFHSQEVLLSSYYVKVVRDTWFWFPHEGGWKRIFWSLSPSTFGWFGVELFLLLSGFLIHHNTLKKDLPVNWMDFLSKRFWRIYPAYFLAILVFGFAMGPFSALDWVLHLLLIHNLYEPTFFGINGSFWSLALEAQLYLVYPVLLLMRGRWGMGRTTLIIAGLSLVTLLVQQWVGPFGSSFKVSIARLWITWALGAWIAEHYSDGRLLFKRHVLWMVFLILIFPLVVFSFIRPFLLRYVLVLLSALLLEYVIWKWRVPPKLKGMWKTVYQMFLLVGVSSYSFYLFHQPFLPFIYAWLPFEGIFGGQLLECVFVFVFIALCSYGIFVSIELPFIRIGQRLRRRSSTKLP